MENLSTAGGGDLLEGGVSQMRSVATVTRHHKHNLNRGILILFELCYQLQITCEHYHVFYTVNGLTTYNLI